MMNNKSSKRILIEVVLCITACLIIAFPIAHLFVVRLTDLVNKSYDFSATLTLGFAFTLVLSIFFLFLQIDKIGFINFILSFKGRWSTTQWILIFWVISFTIFIFKNGHLLHYAGQGQPIETLYK